MTEDLEEQEDKLLALQSIFDADEFVRDESKSAGEIRVCVELPIGFSVALREEGMKALWEDYVSGSKERKRLLENRYGCNLLVSIMEKNLSDNWIANNSKSCPECFTRIAKDGGCNRMMCTRCKKIFCWNCLTRLTPEKTTEHFYGGQCSS